MESSISSFSRQCMRIGLVLSLCYAQTTIASMAEESSSKIGPWKIEKYEWTNGSIGRDYCRMTEQVGDDEFQILINPAQVIDLAVKSPKIKNKDDAQLNLYAMIGGHRFEAPADEVLDTNSVRLSNFDMKTFLPVLMQATSITIVGAGPKFTFPLPQGAMALEAVKKCVTDQIGFW